ncbi:MAG TPA: class I SAM-dependent methyltransferase [Candidatus Aquilonibacter sp.]|jgi:SAM-dependent methyltransferase|nr:class I SAM-dependent methyltransferase [Candidatus Aquilonibacter sp.]
MPASLTRDKAPSRPSLLSFALKKINNARCTTWDLVHGVQTCGEIPLTSLDFKSENKNPGLEYQSHHPTILHQMLSALNIEHERYAFIDFGCGKGRVLLVAAGFPFRKIVGVEFAPQLAEDARRNLKNYRVKRMRCKDLSVLTMDATEYELPSEPGVLFFYSPFTGAVMEKVVANIEDSLRRSPRELFVLFTGVPAMRERAFGIRPQFKRLTRERYFDVYQYVADEIAA